MKVREGRLTASALRTISAVFASNSALSLRYSSSRLDAGSRTNDERKESEESVRGKEEPSQAREREKRERVCGEKREREREREKR